MPFPSRALALALPLTLSLGAAACHRAPPPGASLPDASATANAAASSASDFHASPPVPADAVPGEFPAWAKEARREHLTEIGAEPLLRPHEAVVREHFGGTLPASLDLQVMALPGERQALLLSAVAPDVKPLLLVVDAQGKLLWSKERPLAGVFPRMTELALASGPSGDVVLSWFDPPTHLVAVRWWSAVGTVLADFRVLETDASDGLSMACWPGHGWLIVSSSLGAARAQLLTDRGMIAWGKAGREVASGSGDAAPMSIVVDTRDTVMLFQVGFARDVPGKNAPNRILASRYDATGTALWDQSIDVGLAPLPGKNGGNGATPLRVGASRVAPGTVRVTLIPGVLGGAPRSFVDVSSTGLVLRPQ